MITFGSEWVKRVEPDSVCNHTSNNGIHRTTQSLKPRSNGCNKLYTTSWIMLQHFEQGWPNERNVVQHGGLLRATMLHDVVPICILGDPGADHGAGGGKFPAHPTICPWVSEDDQHVASVWPGLYYQLIISIRYIRYLRIIVKDVIERFEF